MKKSKNIVLVVTPVLSAALLNACGGSTSQPLPLANTTTTTSTPVSTPVPLVSAAAPETTQTRDVYNTLDDCVKDWGSNELCEQMNDDDDRDYKSKFKKKSSGKYFFGPQYMSNNRIITYKGKTVSPTGKVTKLPAFTSTAPASKTTTSTTSTSTSTAPSTTTSKSTTSSTLPSSKTTTTTTSTTTSTTSPTSSTSTTSSTSSYTPSSSSSSSTTRSGFGSTSSYSSSSSSGS